MNEDKSNAEILKVKPPDDYPPEEGCYLLGNPYSPVAVVCMLNCDREKTPPEIERLSRVSIEKGAAIAGTLQTENIGVEKIICNIAANPNIRYLIICGTEVNQHYSGDALKALIKNGINDKRTIIGTKAPTPYLFNIPLKAIKRFRQQLTLVDLLDEMDPGVVSQAVWSCYQEPEKPVQFNHYMLYDPGAYPEPAICCTLTGKIKDPSEIEEWELDKIIKEIGGD